MKKYLVDEADLDAIALAPDEWLDVIKNGAPCFEPAKNDCETGQNDRKCPDREDSYKPSLRIVSTTGTTLTYAHPGDAGMDLRASESTVIPKGMYGVVHTGVHIECPQGCVAYVMPRSGLAVKHGITVLNAPGVIDSGYRGEIVVPLINLGNETFWVEAGDRIAQIIISPYVEVSPCLVDRLSESQRGCDGLGSTGVK